MSETSTATPRLWLKAGLVFVAAWAFLAHLQFQTEWLLSVDGWYHIRYADLLPSLGFQNEFRWAAQSMWAEHFADKQILYHLYLVPFTRFGDLAAGMKHATVLLGSGVVVSFYLVLGLNRLRFPLLWTLLLFASGEWFLYRLSMPRPHVLSILLLLWCLHFILHQRRRALAVTIFIYSLSYAAFHVPLGLALILSAHTYLTEKRLEWKTPAVILGAMTVGILLNPHFPETLRWFWTINVMVPLASWGQDVNLRQAIELKPFTTLDFIRAHLTIVAGVFAAAYAGFVRPTRPSETTRRLFLVFCVYVLLVSLSRRFVEYSIPIGLLFLAAYTTDLLRGIDLGEWRRKRPVAAYTTMLAGALATATLLIMSYRGAVEDIRLKVPLRKEAALYLLDHTEADELVFTCDWDDAPELFYFNQKNRYPVIMDPYYMYAHDPELWAEWAGIGQGAYGGRSYDLLARHYRHGVCTLDFDKFRKIVEQDPRMQIVFESETAWVFRLDLDNPEIPLDQFLEMAPGD